MTTIHPAQRLLLSALTVVVSAGAVAYGKMPTTPSRLPPDFQGLRQYRPEMNSSEGVCCMCAERSSALLAR